MNEVRRGEPFSITRALNLVVGLEDDEPVGFIRRNAQGLYVGYDMSQCYVAGPGDKWATARTVWNNANI